MDLMNCNALLRVPEPYYGQMITMEMGHVDTYKTGIGLMEPKGAYQPELSANVRAVCHEEGLPPCQ